MKMHLHIISAGEHIHDTLPKTVKGLKDITHVGIVVEKDIYIDNPKDPDYLKETKPKIREAISNVKTICNTFDIVFSEIRIPDTSLISVRDAILTTIHKLPNPRLSFNLSGGTKMLSLSLFVMAIWLDGEIYLTPNSQGLIKMAIPKMHLNDVRKNPNYIHALNILGEYNGKSKSAETEAIWILGKDFSRELMNRYERIRFPKDKKIQNKPNRGTITKIIAPLLEWGLIEDRTCQKSKKEKEYHLTTDGLFALSILKSEDEKAEANIVDN